ncbi:MAG TPA: YggS family pyridoxal phosphate-dependent enzyme, partial [Pyrinomonadaceae bacterium]|nr:YggS family pyridoxal phosphate-dependent enzyme [Pyrinomonadaceae bacterium]
MVQPTEAATDLRSPLAQVRERIATAAARGGRESTEVTLVAVSKTHPAAAVRAALSAGVIDFGENRVQEAESKIPLLKDAGARWHLIGHLQANKARRAVRLFEVIHTVDSTSLAERLDRACADEQRQELRILIQVDLAGEVTKSGVAENKLSDLVESMRQCPRLRLTGLMVLPPFFEDPEQVRPFFKRLRELRDEIQSG